MRSMSSSAFLSHVTLKESSSVDRAVFASFTGPSAQNVVALRGSSLTVYSLVGGGEGATGSTKLVLEAHVNLFGSVQDVAVVRFAGADRDALVVSFADAKCSICEWNVETGDVKTLSMHYFETDQLKLGFTRFHAPPKLSVDPANRCVAMMVLDRHIAFIAASEERDTADAISALYGLATARTAKTQASWVVPMSDITKTGQLLDIAFLHDYFQPTLLVLTEERPTWSGRALAVWNTRAVTAISLDLRNRKWSIIWSVPSIGNDVHSVWPVPSPVGGAVLLAANAVYYVNQTTRYAMAVNIHGTVNSPFPRMALWKSTDGIVLDAARLCFVAATSRYASAIISDKRGVLYVMNLMVGGSSVDSMEIASIGASSVASSLCVVPGGYIFLASRMGDSLLLKCSDASSSSGGGRANGAAASSSTVAAEAPTKRIKSEKNREEDALFDQLFSSSAPTAAVEAADGDATMAGDEQDREDVREAEREAQAEADAREAKMEMSRLDTPRATVLWSLSVADSILAVPVTAMVVAPSLDAASLSNHEELQDNPRHLMDVVACSGMGKSGCLAVMQQSVRPDLFLSFPIGFVNAAWALYEGNESPFHQYLVLSRRRSTALLSTGSQELHEIEQDACSLLLDTPTVGVWSCPGPSGEPHARIIQVTRNEIRLCAGHNKLLQAVDTSVVDVPKSSVVSASFAGGVLVLLRRNGQIGSWRYDVKADQLVQLGALDEKDDETAHPWASCYVYVHPRSAHVSWHVLNEDQLTMNTLMREMREQGKSQKEIEEMLGGSLEELAAQGVASQDQAQDLIFVVASRLSGSFEMWLLEGETFRLVFWTMGFVKGEPLVSHEQKWSAEQRKGAVNQSQDGQAAAHSLFVQEICIYRSEDRGLPMIFCVTSQNDVFVYKSVHTGVDDHVLPLRFRRMPLNFVSRAYADVATATATGGASDKSAFGLDDDVAEADGAFDGAEEKADAETLPYSRQLIVFNNVCGRRGIFFRGRYRSGWCFFTSREFPNAMVQHNIYGEGLGFNAFTPFHYQSCRRGFITVSADGKLRIAQLRLGSTGTTNGEVDGSWIVRKVPIRTAEDAEDGLDVTPTAIDYHAVSQHFVVASMTAKLKPVVLADERPGAVNLHIPVAEERWRISLHRGGTLKQSDMVWLDEGEQVLCLKVLSLSRGDDKSGRADGQPFGTLHLPRKLYVVVGTGFVRNGEDVVGDPITGNVRVYGLAPTNDPEHPYTFRMLVKEYVKGPVTAMTEMLGYFVYQVGPKTMMTLMGVGENVLVGKGFFDGQVYTTSLQAVKNYIMFTDCYRSMYFLIWREDVRQLQLLGKDYGQGRLIEGNLLVDYDALSLVGFDEDGNIRCFKYDPASTKTRDGHQLVVSSEYCLGSRVSSSARIACHSLTANPMYNQTFYRRNGIVFSGVDGSLHLLVPIQETDYRRLQLLCVQLNSAVPHQLGLNPMEHRAYKSYYSSTSNTSHNDDNNPPIDVNLIADFTCLPANKRRELARKIGTHQRYVFKSAIEITYSSSYF